MRRQQLQRLPQQRSQKLKKLRLTMAREPLSQPKLKGKAPRRRKPGRHRRARLLKRAVMPLFPKQLGNVGRRLQSRRLQSRLIVLKSILHLFGNKITFLELFGFYKHDM